MLSSIVRFLIDPFHVLIGLVLLFALGRYLKLNRLAFYSGISALLWFLISTTPLVPTILMNQLEDRYTPVYAESLSDLDAPYHIVVLGSGHGFDDRLPANTLLSQRAVMRLSEGIRLHRMLPNSTLILSGYSSSGRTTQAEMLRDAAVLLGVEEERTRIQTEPSNTFEEAAYYSSRFGSESPLIVVTSASHMPRAMVVFEMHGTQPTASPTDYRLKGSWKQPRLGWPSLGNLDNLRAALFEYAALTRERLRGAS
ncbi:MAG: YdcF family protein [Balneolaceae bacterium]|nr:YdcF family protein [Balneolaceae bacterium]MCH8549467.1 YdcF family protein [Balneolaceae bacterium]